MAGGAGGTGRLCLSGGLSTPGHHKHFGPSPGWTHGDALLEEEDRLGLLSPGPRESVGGTRGRGQGPRPSPHPPRPRPPPQSLV